MSCCNGTEKMSPLLLIEGWWWSPPDTGGGNWGELLGDPAITTAVLDRIVYKCEVINFINDDSYRIKHRQTILDNESE